MRPLRNLLALVTIAVVLAALTSPTRALAWNAGDYSASAEDTAMALITDARVANGQAGLPIDLDLRSFARWRAQDMGERDYFSHSIPPDGTTVFDALRQGSYCYETAAESIAKNDWPDDQTIAQAVDGWLATTDKAKLLGSYRAIGIGTYKVTDGNHYIVALLSVPCPPVTPAPTSAPLPTAVPDLVTPSPGGTLKPTGTPIPAPRVTVVPAPVCAQ